MPLLKHGHFEDGAVAFQKPVEPLGEAVAVDVHDETVFVGGGRLQDRS